MEGGNRSSDANNNNSNNDINAQNECDRILILGIMRDMERCGILPPPPLLESSTEATTTQRNRIEDEDNENLVSTVNVNIRGLENLSENIGIRELDERWRGENVDRVKINTLIEESEYDETEDYLTTFKLADNIIVIRIIQDFRQGSHGLNYSTGTQIIWNSKFSWRQIKQQLQDYTYKFIFKYEVIGIGTSNFAEELEVESSSSTDEEELTEEEDAISSLYTEEEDAEEDITNSGDTEEEEYAISSDTEEEEEELSSSFRAAVDALPQALICREEEKGDEVIMCAICRETFSIEDSAKQLPCKHFYHSKCILLWFARTKSCPLCRGEVVLRQKQLLVLNIEELN